MTRVSNVRFAGAAIAALAIGSFVFGCGQKSASGGTPAARAQSELAKKLSGMKPEERAAYLQAHPEAMSTLARQQSPDGP